MSVCAIGCSFISEAFHWPRKSQDQFPWKLGSLETWILRNMEKIQLFSTVLTAFNCIQPFSKIFIRFHLFSSVFNHFSMFSTPFNWCYYPQPPRYSVSPLWGTFFENTFFVGRSRKNTLLWEATFSALEKKLLKKIITNFWYFKKCCVAWGYEYVHISLWLCHVIWWCTGL